MAGDVYAVHDGTVKWLHTQFSHLVVHGEPEVQAEKNKSETTHTEKKKEDSSVQPALQRIGEIPSCHSILDQYLLPLSIVGIDITIPYFQGYQNIVSLMVCLLC